MLASAEGTVPFEVELAPEGVVHRFDHLAQGFEELGPGSRRLSLAGRAQQGQPGCGHGGAQASDAFAQLDTPAGLACCCEQICPQQREEGFRTGVAQAGSMAHDEKNPLFSERVREQLLVRRILVLDGILDDDNGTLLATQLLTLAVEDPAADVALWIHSPGGSVPSMLAIRDVMRLVPCDVSTLALGLSLIHI